jgi:nucleoside-diphosphate-sugar epimerase
MPSGTLLITGATGLVGSHIAERALAEGYAVRALVREQSPDRAFLDRLGVEIAVGDLTDAESLRRAVKGARWIVHCAAMVGDWGRIEDYRRVNYTALKDFLEAAKAEPGLDRFVMMSSLGVYEARDHFGTDETTPPNVVGIDEAQFFDDGILETAERFADAGIRVICAGLDQDYRGQPFGPMPALMSIAEFVSKLHAVCNRCGAAACRSQRLVGTEGQLFVGGMADYEPRCRACFVPGVVERE